MELHGYLPSPVHRWCTVELKTKPFQKYIKNTLNNGKNSVIYLYIGIRADEPQRAKYNKYNNPQIKEIYPFVDYGIDKNEVFQILYKTGIDFPKYYEWSNRSGCYFCPFQTKMNWINLYNNHPDLFFKAKSFETSRNDKNNGRYKKVGWNMDMLLEDMIKPENMKKIKEKHALITDKKKDLKIHQLSCHGKPMHQLLVKECLNVP